MVDWVCVRISYLPYSLTPRQGWRRVCLRRGAEAVGRGAEAPGPGMVQHGPGLRWQLQSFIWHLWGVHQKERGRVYRRRRNAWANRVILVVCFYYTDKGWVKSLRENLSLSAAVKLCYQQLNGLFPFTQARVAKYVWLTARNVDQNTTRWVCLAYCTECGSEAQLDLHGMVQHGPGLRWQLQWLTALWHLWGVHQKAQQGGYVWLTARNVDQNTTHERLQGMWIKTQQGGYVWLTARNVDQNTTRWVCLAYCTECGSKHNKVGMFGLLHGMWIKTQQGGYVWLTARNVDQNTTRWVCLAYCTECGSKHNKVGMFGLLHGMWIKTQQGGYVWLTARNVDQNTTRWVCLAYCTECGSKHNKVGMFGLLHGMWIKTQQGGYVWLTAWNMNQISLL